jgi:hypothetical protein
MNSLNPAWRQQTSMITRNVERLTLRLLKSSQVLHIFSWLTLYEFIHLELIHHPRLLSLASRRHHVSPIGI